MAGLVALSTAQLSLVEQVRTTQLNNSHMHTTQVNNSHTQSPGTARARLAWLFANNNSTETNRAERRGAMMVSMLEQNPSYEENQLARNLRAVAVAGHVTPKEWECIACAVAAAVGGPFVLGDAFEKVANLYCSQHNLTSSACAALEEDAVVASYLTGLVVLPFAIIEGCGLATCFQHPNATLYTAAAAA